MAASKKRMLGILPKRPSLAMERRRRAAVFKAIEKDPFSRPPPDDPSYNPNKQYVGRILRHTYEIQPQAAKRGTRQSQISKRIDKIAKDIWADIKKKP